MFNKQKTKEEIKLWKQIFELREQLKTATEQMDLLLIGRNKTINMHMPVDKNDIPTCRECDQAYPCKTLLANRSWR